MNRYERVGFPKIKQLFRAFKKNNGDQSSTFKISDKVKSL